VFDLKKGSGIKETQPIGYPTGLVICKDMLYLRLAMTLQSALFLAGGVLFSLEEGASFLKQMLTWRMVDYY